MAIAAKMRAHTHTHAFQTDSQAEEFKIISIGWIKEETCGSKNKIGSRKETETAMVSITLDSVS